VRDGFGALLRPVRGSSTAPVKSPKRCANPVHLALLSPDTQERFQVQAQTMRKHMQVYAEEAIGKCVPQSHLQRFYGERCERAGWELGHGSVMGEQPGRLTAQKIVKRNSKRFHAYRIP